MEKNYAYENVTNAIISMLEQGVVPWHKTWHGGVNSHKNFINKREYRGINTILLSLTPYACPYWASFKQISDKGGKVKEGEHGTTVVFWKYFKKEETDADTGEIKTKTIPMLRYYKVFNLEQTTGIDWEMPVIPENTLSPIEACEDVVVNYKTKPCIKFGGNAAYYSPRFDYIQLPEFENFESAEDFYSTEFHEMVHSTGHENRLARSNVMNVERFGSENYSAEELVAELGAAFLCAETGIAPATINNSASYIDNWIKVFKNNKKILIEAASKAQKAVDYILGKTQTEEKGE